MSEKTLRKLIKKASFVTEAKMTKSWQQSIVNIIVEIYEIIVFK